MIENGMTYNAPVTTGATTTMSLTKTDILGNDMTVTWSVTGTTLNWSVNVVPAAGISVGLHRFLLYNYNSINFDTYADEDFEDPYGVGYGNTTWAASGSIDLTTTSNPIDFSFEYLTDEPSTGNYSLISCQGKFIY